MVNQNPSLFKKINFPSALAASLSVANLVLVLPFLLVVMDYYEMMVGHAAFRMQFRSILFDIVGMTLSIIVLVYSIRLVVRYFRHVNVKPFWPVVFFFVYLLSIVISALNQY